MGERKQETTRRAMIVGGLAATLWVVPARATPEQMRAAIRNIVGTAPVRQGRVELDVPPLVENGNTVSLVVTVDSPMTASDYVKSIHVFNEKNPQPNVVAIHLGPHAMKGWNFKVDDRPDALMEVHRAGLKRDQRMARPGQK
jgi:sulfur-oxidizing protein SoxY